MNGEAAILPVVNRLYAAAAEPDGWNDALQGMVETIGAGHAILLGGGAPGDGGFVASAGLEQCDLHRALSQEAYQLAAPYRPMTREDAVLTISTVVGEREWERCAYYNEIVRPMNGYYGALAGRWRYPSDRFILAVCQPRSTGDFDATRMAILQSLQPHFGTAIELHLRLRASQNGGESFTRLLDRLEAGVILADAAARPVFANARARRIAAEADGLLLLDDGLAGATATATERLRAAVAACAGAETNRHRVQLERPSRRQSFLLSLLPLARLGTSLPGARAPRVAIFITEPDAPAAVDRVALADAYRLTRRESEVAILLADGLSLDLIAVRLDIGRGTVRSHLERLFDKTGAHSQPTLVALIRGFAEVCH